MNETIKNLHDKVCACLVGPMTEQWPLADIDNYREYCHGLVVICAAFNACADLVQERTHQYERALDDLHFDNPTYDLVHVKAQVAHDIEKRIRELVPALKEHQ